MKRRKFIQAAALLPATASKGKGRVSASQPPALAALQDAAIDIDIADPANTNRQCQNAEHAYVRLFELRPPDPGLLSGAQLHILDRGQETALTVDIGTQFLGFVEYDSLVHFLKKVKERGGLETGASLLEHSPGPYRCCSNGGYLTLIPGRPELRVIFGEHCFGFLKGRLAAKFLLCLRQRLAEGAEAA
jgi:hypothetical protein